MTVSAIKIELPLTKEKTLSLKAGDRVLLSGKIYTARDQAHKRICADLASPPFSLAGAVIYYAGPSPAPPGKPIGSVGPTTSYRMDAFAPQLLDKGVLGMIGKGNRDDNVIESIKKNKAIYMLAGGGFGALLASKVKSAKVVAYDDLGAEAIRELEVEDFPVIIGIDALGNSALN